MSPEKSPAKNDPGKVPGKIMTRKSPRKSNDPGKVPGKEITGIFRIPIVTSTVKYGVFFPGIFPGSTLRGL
jgi:hypothetical protein